MLLLAVAWSTSTGIRLLQEPPLVVIFGLMERNQSVMGFRLVIIISVIIISLKPIMLILEKFASTLPHTRTESFQGKPHFQPGLQSQSPTGNPPLYKVLPRPT